VLFVAFAFPMLIEAPSDGTAVKQATLDGEGASVSIEDTFRLDMTNKNDTEAEIRGTSLNSGDNDTVALKQAQTGTITLDNQSVMLTAVVLDPGTDGTVTLDVRYPSDFSWSEESTALSNQLPLIMAIVAGLIVLGLVGGMVRS
jgi:hypothetical protein